MVTFISFRILEFQAVAGRIHQEAVVEWDARQVGCFSRIFPMWWTSGIIQGRLILRGAPNIFELKKLGSLSFSGQKMLLDVM